MKPFRYHLLYSFLLLLLLSSCFPKKDSTNKEEQIRLQQESPDTTQTDTVLMNAIRGNLSFTQIPNSPNRVVLTGLAQHRLVTIYKKLKSGAKKNRTDEYGSYYSYEPEQSEYEHHFMPGIDLIYGYNLLNVAHYDLSTDQLNYLFQQPVLIKSLYYPSFEQDSLHKKPINRDYYLASVFDEDTNGDTLINKTDLRRFYYFNASCTEKIQLIPPDYSVARSQYDSMNDVMYIFARRDTDHDGKTDIQKEPMHIFWISLKNPAKAKRLY